MSRVTENAVTENAKSKTCRQVRRRAIAGRKKNAPYLRGRASVATSLRRYAATADAFANPGISKPSVSKLSTVVLACSVVSGINGGLTVAHSGSWA